MKYVWVVVMCLLLAIPATAQDEIVVEVGDLALTLPEGWYLPEDDYEAFYVMGNDIETVVILHDTGLEALLVSPEQVAAFVPDADEMDYQDILIELTSLSYGIDISEDEFFPVDLGLVDGVRWFYEDTESVEDDVLQGDLYLIPLADGGYLYADIYTFQSYFEEDTESLEVAMEALFVSAGAVLLDESAVQGEACFVSTDSDDSATVRVGPGINRTALLFLPADVSFTVTGRFVADDDSVWYQLDKEEIDPSSSAAELWVAQDDVFEEGDCDLVDEASAPPLRPIVSAPPTGNTDNGGEAPAAGSLPADGSWTLSVAERGLVSCLGTETAEFNTSELDISRSITADLSVDGATFIYGGQLFTPVGTTGYTGAVTVDDGSSVGLNLYVQNTGFMSGEIVANVRIENVDCSLTIPATASLN